MNKRLGLSELSVILWVSAFEGCLLSGVPLYSFQQASFLRHDIWSWTWHYMQSHTVVCVYMLKHTFSLKYSSEVGLKVTVLVWLCCTFHWRVLLYVEKYCTSKFSQIGCVQILCVNTFIVPECPLPNTWTNESEIMMWNFESWFAKAYAMLLLLR